MRVGILCDNSNMTVSQWKCFTASTESLNIESWASALISFISGLILVASSEMMAFDIFGELITVDAIET